MNGMLGKSLLRLGKVLSQVLLLFGLMPATAKADLLLKNVTLISGDAERNKVSAKKAYLWVVKGKIRYIGSQLPKVSKSTQQYDGQGGFLIPGLIDSHVHLGQVAGIITRDQQKKARLTHVWHRWEASAYLRSGFTSLIDLGEANPAYLREFYPPGAAPRVFGVGQTVRQLDGYGHNFFKKPDAYVALPNFLIGSAQHPPENVQKRDHEPARLVGNAQRNAAIAIKTFYEDGFSGVFTNLHLPEIAQLQELKRSASAAQLPLILHATSLRGYQVARDVGVDVIAHGLWHRETGDFSQPMPIEMTKELFVDLAKHGTMVQPTVRVVLAEGESDQAISPQQLLGLPKELCEFYLSPSAQAYLEEGPELLGLLRQRGFVTSETSLDSLRKLFSERALTQLKGMHQAGIKFLFGTDTPTPTGAPVALPGKNAYLEMQAWVKAGIPLEQLFLALTDRNARKFKLQKIGRLQKNYLADMVLLRKNPLQDLAAYEEIQQVWIAGQTISMPPHETCGKSSAE